MFNKFIAAGVVVAGLGAVGVNGDVQAKIGKALGLVEKPAVSLAAQFSPVSCEDGAALVEAAGYTHVFATECSGAQYHFNAFHGKTEYSVVFNATGKGMTAISR